VVIGFELSKPAVSEIQFQLMLERERAINPADADNRRQQKAIQARSAQAGSAAAILLRGIRFPSLDSLAHSPSEASNFTCSKARYGSKYLCESAR